MHLVEYDIPTLVHTSGQEKTAIFGFGNQLFMSQTNLISVKTFNTVQHLV